MCMSTPPRRHPHSTYMVAWTLAPLVMTPLNGPSQPPPPPLPSHMDNSHGCTMSPSNDENPPDQTLQPHDPVCNSNINNNNKKIEHTMMMIYTQNVHGLWRHPQDPNGNILVDAPPDLSKVKYIVDYMHQHDVRAWSRRPGKKKMTSTLR